MFYSRFIFNIVVPSLHKLRSRSKFLRNLFVTGESKLVLVCKFLPFYFLFLNWLPHLQFNYNNILK